MAEVRGLGGGRMVKLTAELIEQAAQYTNAVRDRELDLRGELGGSRAVSGLGARPGGAGPAACAEAGAWPGGLPPGFRVPPPIAGPSGPFGAVCYPLPLTDTASPFLPGSVFVRLCPACSAA